MKQYLIPVVLIASLAACAQTAPPPPQPAYYNTRPIVHQRRDAPKTYTRHGRTDDTTPTAQAPGASDDSGSPTNTTDRQFTPLEDRFISTHDPYTAAYELGIPRDQIKARTDQMEKPKN